MDFLRHYWLTMYNATKKIFNPLGMYTSRPAMFTEYRVFYGPCPRMFYMEMLFSLL